LLRTRWVSRHYIVRGKSVHQPQIPKNRLSSAKLGTGVLHLQVPLRLNLTCSSPMVRRSLSLAGCTGSRIRCSFSLLFDRRCLGRRRCCKSTRSLANRFVNPLLPKFSKSRRTGKAPSPGGGHRGYESIFRSGSQTTRTKIGSPDQRERSGLRRREFRGTWRCARNRLSAWGSSQGSAPALPGR
jgi:hypothetical protein